MRTPFIAANWKENKTNLETAKFLGELKKKIKNCERDVVICPSFVSIITAYDCAKNSPIKIGAQDISVHRKGAYTGEVSVSMLKDFCLYAIIGHSERRKYFKERNEIVNRKVLLALKSGLMPILCIGEDLDQRQNKQTEELLQEQLDSGLEGVDSSVVRKVVVAYEPIWAISSGDPNHKPATPKDAEKAHKFIRNTLAKMYDPETAVEIRIIYGGSAKPENMKSFMDQQNIDGALVGNASLDVDSFSSIINY